MQTMTKTEAMKRFADLLDSYQPNWRDDLPDRPTKNEKKKGLRNDKTGLLAIWVELVAGPGELGGRGWLPSVTDAASLGLLRVLCRPRELLGQVAKARYVERLLVDAPSKEPAEAQPAQKPVTANEAMDIIDAYFQTRFDVAIQLHNFARLKPEEEQAVHQACADLQLLLEDVSRRLSAPGTGIL